MYLAEFYVLVSSIQRGKRKATVGFATTSSSQYYMQTEVHIFFKSLISCGMQRSAQMS